MGIDIHHRPGTRNHHRSTKPCRRSPSQQIRTLHRQAQKRLTLLQHQHRSKRNRPRQKNHPVHPSQRLPLRRHPRRSQHRLQCRKQARITAFPQKQHTGTPTKYDGLSSGVVFQADPASGIFLCIYGFYRTPSKRAQKSKF